MREYKFKGKRRDNGEWVYGDLFNASSGVTIIENGGANREDFHFVDPETVGQFAGLLDKNKKEIWENDIIESKHWDPQRYEVVFNRGGFCMKFGEDSNFYPDIKYAEVFEVIGNKFDNPNLLK